MCHFEVGTGVPQQHETHQNKMNFSKKGPKGNCFNKRNLTSQTIVNTINHPQIDI